MADNDIAGRFEYLLDLCRGEEWLEVWTNLQFSIETFESLGVARDVSDRALWEVCQQRQVILVTGNRNGDGPDSLESTLRSLNTHQCLPVITLADPERIRNEKAYALKTAERLLEYLFDIENYRGTGRLYVP